MPIRVISPQSRNIPMPNDIIPIMFYVSLVDTITDNYQFLLNENINLLDPRTGTSNDREFRVINCRVDLTNLAGTAIAYITVAGDQCIYYPYYSGIHVLNGIGIVSLAAGVSTTGFQVGV